MSRRYWGLKGRLKCCHVVMLVAFLVSAHAGSTGEIRRGWLGVSISDLLPTMQQMLQQDFGLESKAGVMVEKIVEGSPAEKAGLRESDVIIRVGDTLINDNSQLVMEIALRQPGSKMEIAFIRGVSLRETSVTLGEAPSGKSEHSETEPRDESRTGSDEGSSIVFLDELDSAPLDCLLVGDIMPLRTTAFELEEAYGTPVAREKGLASRTEVFVDLEDGIKSLLARYAKDRPALKWARVRLVNQLSTEAVCVLFDLRDSQSLTRGHAFVPDRVSGGHTIHFMRDGVHFYVLDGVVREIWVTLSHIAIERFREDVSSALNAVNDTQTEKQDDTDAAEPSPPQETLAEMQTKKHDNVGSAEQIPAEEAIPTRRIRIKDLQVTTDRRGKSNRYRVQMSTELAGFSGGKLKCGVYLVNDRGEHLRALSDALREDKDDKGLYCPHSSRDISGAAKSTLSVPLILDEQNAGRGATGGRLHIRAVAIAPDRVTALLEREYSLPDHHIQEERPDRRINIGFSRVQAGTLEHEEQRLEGLWLYAPIGVDNCKGETLACTLHLLRTDGAYVQASDSMPAYYDKSGRFYAVARAKVRFSTARWEPFRIFIPYDALVLEGGRTYSLYVRFHANVAGLWGYSVQLIQLRMP